MGFIPTEEEKKFAKDYVELFNDSKTKSHLLIQIEKMVKDFPNDQELGSEIRKLITNNK